MPETDWEAALQTLERADRRLLTLNLEDLAIVDRALMDRFYAISGILALPADPVPSTAVERLQVAFEAGISLAERLTEVRESARAELSHINQIRLTLQTAQPDPRHVDCLG
jgi:hypothetical protein